MPGDPPDGNEQIAAILEDAENGDSLSSELLRDGGWALGLYVAQLAEAISPDAIVLAGKVGRSRHYMDGFSKAWNRYASSENKACVEIIRSFKSVIEATVDFAIDRFLLSTDLEVGPLKKIANSAGDRVA